MADTSEQEAVGSVRTGDQEGADLHEEVDDSTPVPVSQNPEESSDPYIMPSVLSQETKEPEYPLELPPLNNAENADENFAQDPNNNDIEAPNDNPEQSQHQLREEEQQPNENDIAITNEDTTEQAKQLQEEEEPNDKTVLDENTVNSLIHMVEGGSKPVLEKQHMQESYEDTVNVPPQQYFGEEERSAGGRFPLLKPGTASIPRIPSPSAEHKEEVEKMELQRQATMLRYPAQMVRMAKVSMSARPRRDNTTLGQYPHVAAGPPTRTAAANYTAEVFGRPTKVIRWDEATNHRPPLTIDMDTPTPCSYSPHLCRPLKENVAPAFTFGRRTFVEKPGGSRTSWQKTWFQSSDVWRQKADFSSDRSWPSPHHYPQKPTLGPRQVTVVGFPAFSIGTRRETSLERKGTVKPPAPGTYDPDKADNVVKRRGPAYTHSHRIGGSVCWRELDETPGPAAYSPRDQMVLTKNPAYTIRGIRRKFNQLQGPFSTPT